MNRNIFFIICMFSLVSYILCQSLNKCSLQNSDCEVCIHVIVVWEEYKRQLIFNHSINDKELKQNLQCAFPEKNYEESGVVLELWNKNLNEYAELKGNTILAVDSKINVKEIPKFQVNTATGSKSFTGLRSEQALRQELLKNYDKHVWPWAEMNTTCTVKTNIMFHKIIDVDLAHGAFSMLVWFRLRWNDPRFTWNPIDWNNIQIMHFSQDEFWDPDVEIWNCMDSLEDLLQEQQMFVNYEGDLFWSRMGQISILCDMKGLDQFPYDKSQCMFEVGSWVYDSSYVDMQYHDVGYQVYESSTSGKYSMFAQYNIHKINVKQYHYPPFDTYPLNNNSWPAIQYYVVLSRHHMQYTYGIVIPQILLTLISFVAFWLPPSCDERLGFTITIPLAIAVYKLLMYEQLPASKELVFASKISFGCFVFTTVVVFESLFVVMLWYRTDPYLFSWFQSFRRLIVDFKELSDWANVVRAIDIEATKRKIEYEKSLSFSKSISLRVIRALGSLRNYSQNLRNNEDKAKNKQMQQKDQFKNIFCLKQMDQNLNQSNHVDQIHEYNVDPNQENNYMQVYQAPEFACNVQSQAQSGNELDMGDCERKNNFKTNENDYIRFPFQSIEDARKFLQEILEEKQYSYAKKSYRCLCDRYSIYFVESNLFRMMGLVDVEKCEFANETISKYNQKWRKLSTLVDRVAQYTVVPSFIIFSVVITCGVIAQ